MSLNVRLIFMSKWEYEMYSRKCMTEIVETCSLQDPPNWVSLFSHLGLYCDAVPSIHPITVQPLTPPLLITYTLF